MLLGNINYLYFDILYANYVGVALLEMLIQLNNACMEVKN